MHVTLGRKRSGVHDIGDLVEDDDVSGKRVRTASTVAEEPSKESSRDLTSVQNVSPIGLKSSRGDEDTGPVQQLVAMFGALVAQGERAVGSLGILISSISTDLLAEVVMANMRHIPPERPKDEGEEESLLNMGSNASTVGSDTQAKRLPPFLARFPQIVALLDAQQSASNDIVVQFSSSVNNHPVPSPPFSFPFLHFPLGGGLVPLIVLNSVCAFFFFFFLFSFSVVGGGGFWSLLDLSFSCAYFPKLQKSQGEEEHHVATVADSDLACGDMDCGTEQGMDSAGVPISSNVVPSAIENFSATSYEIHDVGNLESIPGLDSTAHDDRFVETLAASSLASADLEEGSQEQVTSLGRRSQLDLLPSMSTDRSEELSPKSALTDANSIISSTETSAGLSSQFVLPKLLAPVIDLTDEQKDLIQKLAYARIVDAYKQIAVAGGSHVRFSLLAYLGVQVAILAYRID